MQAIGPQIEICDRTHAEKYRGEGEPFREAMGRVASALSDGPVHFHAFRTPLLKQAFMPAGRIQAAMGSARIVTPYNCFVSGTIDDSFVEGHGSIMNRATEAASTMRKGGGIGYDFSTLRPSGALIRKLNSRSSGPIAFMRVYDAVCKCVASAGHRRGAQMGVMRVDHPDIESFIRAKQNDTGLTGFNISVGMLDSFMRAVLEGNTFELRFGHETYQEIDAQALFETIMRSTWDWAEPGVLFLDTINRLNNLYYCERIAATNPCFTGDTKVWTAEYGHVPFRDLVGRDVEVLTQSEDGRLVYRTMSNIRVTQENAQLVDVRLDNSTVVRCTPQHKFFTKDGRAVAACDLKPGDQLQSVYRYKANQKGYKRLTNGHHQPLEHHIGYEELPDDCHVHHKNGIKYDNRPSNLEIMPGSDHLSMHMTGDANPLRRMPDRNPMRLDPDCTRGERNGRWRADLSTEQMLELRESGMPYEAIAQQVGCSKYTVQKRLQEANHRVAEVVWLETREDVYCGTVDDPTHRFFVATGDDDGVLVANCGEQPLPPYGACLLGSFNLVKYLLPTGPRTFEFNWDAFRRDIPPVVRAMDNVVDRATYPLREQENEAHRKRRMGLGVTGVANALEACGHEYGSPGFKTMLNDILRFMTNHCYRASIELAREKGVFPLFNREAYLEGEFIKRLDDDVREGIARHGIRNSHLTSIAPTGTISFCADNISSGIEPVFSYSQERDLITPNGRETVEVQDFGFAHLGVRGKTCENVTIDEHLGVLATAQAWVDSAVSKTCNVNPSMPWHDFKDTYVKAWELGCKGITTFNPGGKRFGILRDAEANTEAMPDEKGAVCTLDPVTGRSECE